MSQETGVPNPSSFCAYYRIEMALGLEMEAIGSGPNSATQELCDFEQVT